MALLARKNFAESTSSDSREGLDVSAHVQHHEDERGPLGLDAVEDPGVIHAAELVGDAIHGRRGWQGGNN